MDPLTMSFSSRLWLCQMMWPISVNFTTKKTKRMTFSMNLQLRQCIVPMSVWEISINKITLHRFLLISNVVLCWICIFNHEYRAKISRDVGQSINYFFLSSFISSPAADSDTVLCACSYGCSCGWMGNGIIKLWTIL